MDDIILVDYDPRWPALFEEEAGRIRRVLGEDFVRRIEHIGSTAVPGMAAKPIIDMLLGVESLIGALEHAIPILDAMGYSYWADNPERDRLFLVKGLPPNGPRTHHLHIVEMGSTQWDRVLFRDWLHDHPDEAARYEALKHDLAARFPTDREAYTEAKTDYITRITALATQAAEQ